MARCPRPPPGGTPTTAMGRSAAPPTPSPTTPTTSIPPPPRPPRNPPPPPPRHRSRPPPATGGPHPAVGWQGGQPGGHGHRARPSRPGRLRDHHRGLQDLSDQRLADGSRRADRGSHPPPG